LNDEAAARSRDARDRSVPRAPYRARAARQILVGARETWGLPASPRGSGHEQATSQASRALDRGGGRRVCRFREVRRRRAAPRVGIASGGVITTGGGVPPASQSQIFTVTRFDDPAPFDPSAAQCLPDDCTLRDAVWASDKNPGPDTILVPAGTYTFRVHDELP